MIDLAFRANDEEIRRDLGAEPEKADAAVLEHTFFVVPTRFVIDGIELLAYPGVHAAWRPLPLLGFGPHLRRVTTAVEDGETESISLMDGGVLELERRGETLRLSSSLTAKDVAAVSREELMRESARFVAEVCAYLASMAPAMSEHPSWPTWCIDPV